jgi:hypothetical protein
MAEAIPLSLFQGSDPSLFTPAVAITPPADQAFEITWSATPGGFMLQETTSLAAPVDWQFSPLTPALSNGVFTLSIPATADNPRFFRLVTTP